MDDAGPGIPATDAMPAEWPTASTAEDAPPAARGLRRWLLARRVVTLEGPEVREEQEDQEDPAEIQG
jgi:hypothetical protein